VHVLIGSGLVVLLVLMGVGSALFLLFGLAGRLVRTPPLCGRCRFDLSGHGPGQGAGPERPQVVCPECGLRITHPSQVVRFRRQRRGWCLRVGLAGGLVSVGGIVAVVAGTGGTLDGYRLLPTARLIAMAEDGSAGAFGALRARIEADALDDAQWRRVAENAVEEAASSGRERRRSAYGRGDGVSWTPFYGDALRRGVIDRATAEAHAVRMVNLRLELPEPVREGDPLPLRVGGRLRVDPGFDGWSSSPGVDARVVSVRLNGRELLAPDTELNDPTEGDHDFTDDRPTMEASWTWEGTETLPVVEGSVPGENTVEVVVRLTSAFSVGGGAAMVSHVVQPGSPLPWLDVTLSGTVPISRRDPAQTAVAEWDAAGAVESSLSRRCDCGKAPGVRLRLSAQAGLAENAVGFVDVYLGVGDAEPWYLGNKRITPGDSWSEVLLTDEQAALIDRHAGATLRLVPTPWNADLYFDRSRPVVGGADVSRLVVFEEKEDGES
jgi:hypothetical protein